MSEINEIASKHLGQQGSYAVYTDTFDSSLLVAMPRALARKDWGITGEEFIGYDVWHCHEATFLLDNGMPIAGTLKIVYPSSTKFMVESKSFKLYLNSFDMCRMGHRLENGIENYENQIKSDLSKVIGSKVKVRFFESDEVDRVDPTEGYLNIKDYLTDSQIELMPIEDYKGEKTHFSTISNEKLDEEEIKVYTNVLRSRCRHTKQKDTGTAFFHIKIKKGYVNLISLLKEVVSLRELNEFHEFCAEKLYKTISEDEKVIACSVMLLYARRGSLDINPVRASSHSMISEDFINCNLYTKKTMGQ